MQAIEKLLQIYEDELESYITDQNNIKLLNRTINIITKSNKKTIDAIDMSDSFSLDHIDSKVNVALFTFILKYIYESDISNTVLTVDSVKDEVNVLCKRLYKKISDLYIYILRKYINNDNKWQQYIREVEKNHNTNIDEKNHDTNINEKLLITVFNDIKHKYHYLKRFDIVPYLSSKPLSSIVKLLKIPIGFIISEKLSSFLEKCINDINIDLKKIKHKSSKIKFVKKSIVHDDLFDYVPCIWIEEFYPDKWKYYKKQFTKKQLDEYEDRKEKFKNRMLTSKMLDKLKEFKKHEKDSENPISGELPLEEIMPGRKLKENFPPDFIIKYIHRIIEKNILIAEKYDNWLTKVIETLESWIDNASLCIDRTYFYIPK